MGYSRNEIGVPQQLTRSMLDLLTPLHPREPPMSEREVRRSPYPLTIPDRLLQSEDMKRACKRRDFGEIFRLVNRRGPASYAEIAAAVGKMTSARVGDVIRGVRGIRGRPSWNASLTG